jgi:hypothetical protein
LKGLVKSWVGYFISFGENPDLMVQHSVKEIRGSMLRLDEILLQTRGVVVQLEEDVARGVAEESRLLPDIKSHLEEGSSVARQLAGEKAVCLVAVRADLASARGKKALAEKAHASAVLQVEQLKARLKEKMEEAQRAVQESRRADTMKKAAEAVAQLDTDRAGALSEELLSRIRQKSTAVGAAVEIAAGGTQVEGAKPSRAAQEAQARGSLLEREVALGLTPLTAQSAARPSSHGRREKARTYRMARGRAGRHG